MARRLEGRGRGIRARRVLCLAERLEPRSLLSLGLSFANGVGVSGAYADKIHVNATAVDSSGDVYVTGAVKGTANFNPAGSPVDLSNTGGQDLYLAKYLPTGLLAWAETFPGTVNGVSQSTAQGSAIAVNGSGDVYLAGEFSGLVDFSAGAGTEKIQSVGASDGFAVELNPTGGVEWAVDIPSGAGNIVDATSVAVNGSGDVAVGGLFNGKLQVGALSATPVGFLEGFALDLSPTGTPAWLDATQGSSTTVTVVNAVGFDPTTGAVEVAGTFDGTIKLTGGTGTSVTMTSA
ncbi:MAG: hypothetical protein KGM43_14520, partial [Planctomycetota bacterium]|nr:hypothetical protein [Planctomycetota bacterium]